MTELTAEALKTEARNYCRALTDSEIPDLYGVTDGKAVGTYVEHAFRDYLNARYSFEPGSSASGIDFPGLATDLKVTSARQPQSSCPFRDASQKVYGLGYDLLVFVYIKTDDPSREAARLEIVNVLLIDSSRTADYQTTAGIRDLLERDANIDDIDAFLEERRLPLDEVGRRQLAERIIDEPPEQGHITVSNALQWRLQYGRAIKEANGDHPSPGVQELL